MDKESSRRNKKKTRGVNANEEEKQKASIDPFLFSEMMTSRSGRVPLAPTVSNTMANSGSGSIKHEHISSEMMTSRSGHDLFGYDDDDDDNSEDKCSSCSASVHQRIHFQCMACKHYIRCESCEKLEDGRIAVGLPTVHEKSHMFVKLRSGQVFY